jgi:hypothetical protein
MMTMASRLLSSDDRFRCLEPSFNLRGYPHF